MYEHCFRNLNVNIRSKLRRCKALMVGFSGETHHPLGVIDIRVTMGRTGRSKTVLMESAIIKCHSPYNVIIGRTRMRSLGAVGSTIHSMINFPTNQGIITMETSGEALWECRQLERVQGSRKEVQWRQREEKMSKIREQVILRTKSGFGRGRNSGPVSLEKTWDKEDTEEVCIISHERPDQHVTMGITGRGRASIDNEISVQMFPTTSEGIQQIKTTEDDEEKTGFNMKERVYCFTHMPKELKNSAATLQRMMKKVLSGQRGRNVELYLEEIVIKSKSELDLVQDIEETLRKWKRVNIKIDPVTSWFGLKEGRISSEEVLWSRIASRRDTRCKRRGNAQPKQEASSKINPNTKGLEVVSRSLRGCEALLAGLTASVSKGMKDLHVFMDSPKLVAQTEGNHTSATKQERKYKKEIMDATSPFHMFWATHLPKNLNSKVEVLTELATVNLEFLNQEVSVGIKTRPSVEETSSNKKGKAASNVPGAKPNYNWGASGSN
ncbi:reverse transcriptase domain-containing protein [Tanacetum coccineum]